MPEPTRDPEPASTADLRAQWLGHLDRHAAEQRWGQMLVALAALHVAAMVGCYFAHIQYGATRKWIYPAIWVAEVTFTYRIARAFAGRGWTRSSPMSGVVFRVWVTYLILCFSVASLNTLSGFEHDWFKPVWCTLGTFGFATMAWIVSLWFLVPAVQMYFTGLLIVKLPDYAFLIHGLSFGLALTGIGTYLELRRRRAGASGPPREAGSRPTRSRDHVEASMPLRVGAILALLTLAASEEARAQGPQAIDLGPNVLVFDPTMPRPEVQSKLDRVFSDQEHAQFGRERFAYLFRPGKYELDVNLGFYTQAIGLGRVPDDVTISGAVHSEADWMKGNATCTFWRSAENLAVRPGSDEPIHLAVSQGTSFRRMNVHGNVDLWDGGWSSGGFLADSRIARQINSGSQQQWLSRNCEWGRWTGSNWNMVFVGVDNPPREPWPEKPFTVVDQTPRACEKPYLYLNSSGQLAVMVPSVQGRPNSGTSWNGLSSGGMTPVGLDAFHIARPDRDSSASVNAALDVGKHVLFTPGIYSLDAPIHVSRPSTIVMGLGYATLVPQNGTPAIVVEDVAGVKLCSLMIDAGEKDSKVLVLVGPRGSSDPRPDNPTTLHDIFCRVGGATVGRTTVAVEINAHDVIADNLWLWRADHGAGAAWNRNPSETGLIVNGRNVTIYGLFVEHFQKYQVIWNADGGRVYFFQCELPYDPPSQEAWQHDGVEGYAAYKVADSVRTHEARGLGVYGVFSRTVDGVKCRNAVETPSVDGVKIHHLISVWITGKPGTEITHPINGAGPTVNAGRRTALVN